MNRLTNRHLVVSCTICTATQFAEFVQTGIDAGRISPELAEFDLPRLADAIDAERDQVVPVPRAADDLRSLPAAHRRAAHRSTPVFLDASRDGLGDRGSSKKTSVRSSSTTFCRRSGSLPRRRRCSIPAPASAVEFLLSEHRHRRSGPHFQGRLADNAKLSKWAGGLGNDWTNIRATNSHIKGTNGQSQGVIPFLKVVSDTAVAVNQGGKRKGCRLFVSRNMASGYRGVSRSAQEHRR